MISCQTYHAAFFLVPPFHARFCFTYVFDEIAEENYCDWEEEYIYSYYVLKDTTYENTYKNKKNKKKKKKKKRKKTTKKKQKKKTTTTKKKTFTSHQTL